MDINRIRALAGLAEKNTDVETPVEDVTVTDTDTTIVTEDADVGDVNADAPAFEPEKEDTGVKVPADVMKALKTRISELEDAVEEFDDKGYDDASVKHEAIAALKQIESDLKQNDGLTKANIFYNSLISVTQNLLPPKLIKFLHSK